jgi:hypothetical protein
MDYGLKYYLTYTSFKGIEKKLELYEQNYSGSSSAVDMANPNVHTNMPGNNEDLFDPVMGKELKMNFVVGSRSTFVDDFSNISERQWKVIHKKTETANVYVASARIDTLSITNTSTDPTAVITIDYPGQVFQDQVKGFVYFDISIPDTIGDPIPIRLYAVPWDEDLSSSPNRHLLASAFVQQGDTASDVESKLTQDTEISAVSTSYEIGIKAVTDESNLVGGYSQYVIKIDYDVSQGIPNKVTERFTRATVPSDTIKIHLIEAPENQNNFSDVIRLAERTAQVGETTSDVASDLVSQLNNLNVIEEVYIPSIDDYIDIEISATQNGSDINITLVKAGTAGNISVYEKGDFLRFPRDETFMYVVPEGEYDITKADFTGGTEGGDTFTLQVDKGSGWADIVQTTAYSDDTEASIIQRLVNLLNQETELYLGIVNSEDTSELFCKINTDASAWLFRMTTSGGSSLSSTNFQSSTKDTILFMGYVKPGFFKMKHIAGNVEVKMSATCGLGSLKNYNLSAVTGNRFYQKRDIIDILTTSLQQTGLDLPVYEAFDVWEVNHDTSISPLKQTYEDSTRLNNLNCYEIVKEICIITRSRITQNRGHWELIPVEQQHKDFSYRVFNYKGNYVDTVDKTMQVVDAGLSGDVNLLAAPTRSYTPTRRKVIIKQNYGLINQFLKFPTFNRIVEEIGTEGQYNTEYPWQVEDDGVIVTSKQVDIFKDGEILQIGWASGYDLVQKFLISDIQQQKFAKGEQYKISIEFLKRTDDDCYWDYLSVALELTDSSNTVYLKQTDDGFTWETAETYNQFSATDKNETAVKSISFDYPTDELNNSIAEAKLKILIPSTHYNYIKSAKVEIKNTTIRSQTTSVSYYEENVDEISGEKYEKEIKLGDVPSLPNARELYVNALFYLDENGDEQLTSFWYDGTSAGIERRLLDFVRLAYLREYAWSLDSVDENRQGPPVTLEGEVHGDISLHDVVKETAYSNRLFTLIHGKKDERMDIVSGLFQMINVDDSGLTRIDTTEYDEEQTGEQSYTTTEGGEGETQVDLSDYLKESEIISIIQGDEGSFNESDLSANREIIIGHTRNTITPFVLLVENGTPLGYNSEYVITQVTTNNQFTIRVLKPNIETINYRVL